MNNQLIYFHKLKTNNKMNNNTRKKMKFKMKIVISVNELIILSKIKEEQSKPTCRILGFCEINYTFLCKEYTMTMPEILDAFDYLEFIGLVKRYKKSKHYKTAQLFDSIL